MSGNPFRRQQASRLADETARKGDAESLPPEKGRIKKKRVKIQTPPRSPEEPSIARRLSVGETGYPPPLAKSIDDDESDSTATADSDLDQATVNTRPNPGSRPSPPPSFVQQAEVRAPYNPFARTLATSEAAFGLQTGRGSNAEADSYDGHIQARPNAGRPALDVDQFKNILLTGSAAASPPAAQQVQKPHDSSSSTDTSSISRQSIFDNMLEAHPESPRTSVDYDHPSSNDDDDEHSSLMGPIEHRPVEEGPHRPPKPKHGRAFPQTVSFADFDESIPSGFSSGRRTPPVNIHVTGILRPSTSRSSSDLNKPLPPPPADLPKSEIAIPKVPEKELSSVEPDQPAQSANREISQDKKAPPPPPPASRRAGPATSTEGRPRSMSNLTQGSAAEGEQSEGLPRPADSLNKVAPPPPPSRRTQPGQSTPSPAVETPPQAPSPIQAAADSKGVPPPPPRRSLSKTGNSGNRRPSNASHSSLPRNESTQSVLATGNAPPVPPPRRAAGSKRNSIDDPPHSLSTRNLDYRRTSGQSFGSDRSASISSLQQVHEPAEDEEAIASAVSDHSSRDILADLTAFQAEIEALRAQAARNG